MLQVANELAAQSIALNDENKYLKEQLTSKKTEGNNKLQSFIVSLLSTITALNANIFSLFSLYLGLLFGS